MRNQVKRRLSSIYHLSIYRHYTINLIQIVVTLCYLYQTQ